MLLTVVTPSLNGIDYLEECLASVRRQESARVQVEHILVDGGSTDGTPELARERGAVVLARDEDNISYAVNKGMRHASGTFVSVLGCDDVLNPGALDLVVDAYEAEGLPLVIGRCEYLDSAGRGRGVQHVPPAAFPVPMLASLHFSPVPALSTFYRVDLARELDCYDTDYYYAADYELFIRARQRTRYSRVDHALAGWRRHGSNTSMRRSATHEREIAKINATYGPAAPWQRAILRTAMRGWLNTASPPWFVRKQVDRFGPRR